MELFGGYPWYANVVEIEGYQKLRHHMDSRLAFTLQRNSRKRG